MKKISTLILVAILIFAIENSGIEGIFGSFKQLLQSNYFQLKYLRLVSDPIKLFFFANIEFLRFLLLS